MRELEKNSEIPNVIHMMNRKDYLNLIYDKNNRPYDVVVDFNLPVWDQESRCKHCQEMEKAFIVAAYSFKQSSEGLEGREVFFLRYHINEEDDDNWKVFEELHQYSTIPWLSISAAGTKKQ